jgi:L-alanine-DL-glutamate epimerase-like enolase superfamily enzyme
VLGLATDIVVTQASVAFEAFALRSPFVLSTGVITDVTVATATVQVSDRQGRSAEGYGAIVLGDLWAWPSQQVSTMQRVGVMRGLCERISDELTIALDTPGHPLELGMQLLEVNVPIWAGRLEAEVQLPESIPELARTVCAAPFDAALHDAFGRLHQISSYDALDPQFLPHALSTWLGPSLADRHVSEFFNRSPSREVPGWHIVSKDDPLTQAEVVSPIEDWLPSSLEAWIELEGMFCLKIKTTGTDVAFDVARTMDVFRAARLAHERLGTGRQVILEVDSNEACASAELVVEYLRKLREASIETYNALLFVEQPTPRDLEGTRIDMRSVAGLKPVLVDEGLQSLASLPLAAELGWSGAALKTCKTHSLTLLCIAWCSAHGMPYAVVDLTNPGLSAVHSAVLTSRCQPMMGVELNCRQFVPSANVSLAEHWPGLARMTDGMFDMSAAGAVGLGYPEAILVGS